MRLVLMAALVLAGCTSDRFEGEMMRRVATLSNAPASAPARYVALEGAPEMVAAVERRQSAARFRRARLRDGVETWLGEDGVTLGFRGGLLVETRGLGGDLLASDVGPSLAKLRIGGTVRRRMTWLSGEDQAQPLGFDCRIASRGSREIAGGAAVLIEEDCAGAAGGFTNLYWLRGARVVQSRQWAGPFTGMMAMRAF